MKHSFVMTRRTILNNGLQAATLVALQHAAMARPRRHDVEQKVFVSSAEVPFLQFPEGITAWREHVYVGTYNFINPADSRIFVFEAESGALKNTLGGKPGQELISAGAILGLAINPDTGDLYAAANGAGNILRIQRPASATPEISVYAAYPTGTPQPPGPEDLAWHKYGWLYASDSNNRRLYAIPPGGGRPWLVVGPAGSGAMISDQDLFAQPEPGFAPNGLVFSLDFRTLYAANTDTDAVIALDVGPDGMLTGKLRVLAQNLNDAFTEEPVGFESLKGPNTKIGPSAATPLNGPDGLAIDSRGRIWVASVFGDNLTVLNPDTGHVLFTIGSSALALGGLLRQPASLTFVGERVLTTNLGLFQDPKTPSAMWSVVEFDVNVTGAGGNGNL